MTITAPARFPNGDEILFPFVFVEFYEKGLRYMKRARSRIEARTLVEDMLSIPTDPDKAEVAYYALFLAERAVFGKEKDVENY